MATNRMEQGKPPGEGGRPGGEGGSAPAPAAGGASAKAEAPSKMAAWLPLLVNAIVMPVVAYAVSIFVILPKIQAASGNRGAEASPKAGAAESRGQKDEAGQGKVLAPLTEKILVNLAGSMGTRYLLAKITLVGVGASFKEAVEKNDPQLRDVAASALGGKTIADLEKPGSRNLIRAELTSIFNEVLGKGTVSEIYLTEFAIQ
jgi:flagellar FliL protein